MIQKHLRVTLGPNLPVNIEAIMQKLNNPNHNVYILDTVSHAQYTNDNSMISVSWFETV